MKDNISRPVILVFAGPNGSGKTTISKAIPKSGVYINADDIKKEFGLSDLEAAIKAEEIREYLVDNNKSFTFETVLSTSRNLKLLKKAKECGFEIQCIYVLTVNPDINNARVKSRVLEGGHDVPINKIYKRYEKALKLIPELVKVCDKLLIYDNSEMPVMLFEKLYHKQSYFPAKLWSENQIKKLTDYE
jgi:predicted ABC-type ATPase